MSFKLQVVLNTIMTFAMFLISAVVVAETDKSDWRKNETEAYKIEQLLKVMPSASNVMIQMGERYKNLYWAAKLEKWDFAIYQVEEMEELIKTLQITRPARAATAGEFMSAIMPALPEAVESRNWEKFERGFELLRQQCMNCHVKNDHAFVTLPIPKTASSPVLNLD